LNGVEGVQKADVDLEKNNAQIVMHDYIEIERLREAVTSAGGNYNIFLPGEDHASAVDQAVKSPKAGKGTGTFYCPMHCEGDKTYDQPGDCPVCGMDLVEEVSLSAT